MTQTNVNIDRLINPVNFAKLCNVSKSYISQQLDKLDTITIDSTKFVNLDGLRTKNWLSNKGMKL